LDSVGYKSWRNPSNPTPRSLNHELSNKVMKT